MERKRLLINILSDKTASDAERDDAAIQLGNYNDDDVIEALWQVAKDGKCEDIIRGSCGESLAMIWIRRGNVDNTKFEKLKGVAFREAQALIERFRKR